MTDLAATELEVQRRLPPELVAEVKALVDEVVFADGTAPLSEHVMLHLPRGGDEDVRHVLARQHGRLVGYAHLDVTDAVEGSSGELAVHPGTRRRGVGRALLESLQQQSPDGRLRLWAHGEHPGAAAMARVGGFERTRVLWQMRRPLSEDGAPLPGAVLPDGVALRAFVVGQDEPAWVEVNNRAFAEHPDQGGWTVEDVRVREGEPWFDPAGFFLAERGDRLVGFHWTKVHGAHRHPGDAQSHGHDAVGEVYVVGVDPSEQRNGLGPALTLAGLHHLQGLGLPWVMLYVDEKNSNAIRVYERLGFTRHATDVCYSTPR